jgi:nitrate/TMAO reductase-like tetraheme cytochrome c subunit
MKPCEEESQMEVRLKFTGMMSFALLIALVSLSGVARAEDLSFPQGTATPSETCGACHGAIYQEYLLGVGSDIHASHPASQARADGKISLPARVSSSATAHASAWFDTKDVGSEKLGYCNGCHFPEAFNLSGMDSSGKVKPNTGMTSKGGLTCAACHLTPEGNIRGTHVTHAPHRTIVEPAQQSSALCGHCHGFDAPDKRVVGKMFQTFLEWQEDYYKPGLGKQQCQDCHMPRTLRKTAEDFDVPERAVARHLWTGAHSLQRHLNSLSLTLVQPDDGKHRLDLHVSNIGAGHSIPTGEPSRAVFLRVEVLDAKGESKARKEWMFAPSYSNRPDDKAFLEQDKSLPNGTAAPRADAQGPHESSLRAGEDRVLAWDPALAPGEYTVRAQLVYTLDRYSDKPAHGDQSEITSATLKLITK